MDTFLNVLLGILGITLPAIVLGFTLVTGICIYKLARIVSSRVATLKYHLTSREPTAPSPNWALLAQCLFMGSCTPKEVQD